MFSPAEFIAYLKGQEVLATVVFQKAIHTSAKHMEEYVKDLHGRQLPGYPPVNSNPTPLVDTGEMKDSVYSEVNGFTATVSTTDQQKAMWQEYGTGHIPPRRLWLRAKGQLKKEIDPIIETALLKIFK